MKNKPQIGDIRKVKRFAFFPMKIEGKWIFFKWYIKVQKYENYTYSQEYIVSSGLLEDSLTTTGLLNERRATKIHTTQMWITKKKELICKY